MAITLDEFRKNKKYQELEQKRYTTERKAQEIREANAPKQKGTGNKLLDLGLFSLGAATKGYEAAKGIYKTGKSVGGFGKNLVTHPISTVKGTGQKVGGAIKSNFQTPEALKDGFQFSDIPKVAGSTFKQGGNVAKQTTVNMLNKFGSGVSHKIIDLADWVGIAPGASSAYYDIAKGNMAETDKNGNSRISSVGSYKLEDMVNNYQKKIEDNKANSLLSEQGTETLGSITQNIETQLLSATGLMPWQITTGVTSYQTTYENAVRNGATQSQAETEALAAAGLAIGTEYISSGLKLKGTGTQIDTYLGELTDKISNPVVRYGAQTAIQIVGESGEEQIEGWSNVQMRNLIYGTDEKYTYDDFIKDGVAGGLSTLVANGVNPTTWKNIKQGKNLITGNTVYEQSLIDAVTDTTIANAKETGIEIKSRQKVKEDVAKELQETIAKGEIKSARDVVNAVKDGTITQEEFTNILNDDSSKSIIKSKVAASNYVDNSVTNNNYNQIVQGINNNIESKERLDSYKTEINKTLSEDEKYQKMFREKPQEYEQTVEKRALKQYLAEEINTKSQEIDKYFEEKYDTSNKDIQEARDFLKGLVNKKNIRFVFEDDIKAKNGKTADGYVTTAADGSAEIHLNASSDRALLYTVKHELYHIIKNTELENVLVKYALSQTGDEQYETAKKSLLDSYNKGEVNEEAVAELAATLIEDNNFINFLYNDNSANSKGLIKTVVDYLGKFLRNFTEKGREKNAQLKAIEDFNKMWNKSFETQENNLGKETKYEISSEGRNELVRRLAPGKSESWDNNNIVLKNILPKALQNYDKSTTSSVIESHVLNNVLTKEQYNELAKAKGFLQVPDESGKNFHAVGIQDYVEAINGMDDPLAVYQYTSSDKKHNSNEFIFVTKHPAPVKNNKDGSNKIGKKGEQIWGNMVVAYQITDKSDVNNLPKVKGEPTEANIIKTVFSSENALEQYEAKVGKGEMVKVFQGEGKEIPYNLRVEDMNGNLKTLEYKNNELSKVTKDSTGEKLSPEIRKALKRVSKAMFNDKGEFIRWYHTMVSPWAQYTSFDPIVIETLSILTNSPDNKWSCFSNNRATSLSYAYPDVAEDAQPRVKNMKELEKRLANINLDLTNGEQELYKIEQNGEKYSLTRGTTPDQDFLLNLTKEERQTLRKTWLGLSPDNNVENNDARGRIDLNEAIDELRKNISTRVLATKIEAGLENLYQEAGNDVYFEDYVEAVAIDLADNIETKTGVINEYENKDELFKNLIYDIQRNEPLLYKNYIYSVYAYPEQVFEIDVDETGYPGAHNSWNSIYKVDDDVMKSDWGINVLNKFREEANRGKSGEENNYLSTDELASYITLVVNPERIKNGEPPYQAMKVKNILDGLSGEEKADDLIVFNDPRLMKSANNKKPTNDKNMNWSMNNKGTVWEEYVQTLKDSLPYKNKDVVLKKYLKEAKIPVVNKNSTKSDIKSNISNMTEAIQNNADSILPTSKVMSPGEIANLTPESAITTPDLPNYKVQTGEGESKITKSIKKSNFLSEETKNRLVEDAQINSYQTTTNKAEIDEAIRRIDSGGAKETLDWFNKDTKFDGVDVAQGLMYLKLYEEAGDFENATKVTRKLHDITRQYGQAIQAMSMLSRMTPEGMAYHAQTELDEMFNRMVDGKSKEWIEKNRSKFDLTPEEVQSIMDLTKQAANETDDYQKRVDIAKIQKIITDKLPSNLSNKAKSYFRISMLFNPKTQIRNLVGNAMIAPINWLGDVFATAIDKKLAQKSGYRTVSKFNVKDYIKGFKKGAYESYNDFKMDINTRDTEINRYEQLQGKSFSDNNLIGKSLNGVERVLNLAMSGGDRVFYEGEFINALNNLMATNNVDTPTQDMIETAQNVALQRTWNDSNAYTKFVLNFRSSLNKAGGYIHIGNEMFGIGDILLPFAKTPANLTKAIVDYSPLGFLQAVGKRKALLNNIENGTATMQQQRAFVDTMGKAVAGSALYIIAAGLAASGMATGESDDDKDVKDFLQNSLGVSSYSIKTPVGSFTYDWAQPIAAPLAIMTNATQSIKNGDEKTGLKMVEALLGSLNSASSVLMDQSFLQSFNDVMTNNDGVVTGMLQEMAELPARGIPTFLSQVNDMIDDTKRETYYKGHIIQSGLNYAKSKIPGVSQTLAPKRNTLGQEIKKFGGNNNVFNVFFNPANVNSQNMGKNAEEIYRIYESTGDKTVMPSVAPYSDNTTGHIYTPQERSEYQKITGDIINNTIDYLLKYQSDNTGYDYESLSDSEKAEILAKINSFAKQVAKKEILGSEISQGYKNAYKYYQEGNLGAYYIDPKSANYALNYPEKYTAVTSTMTFKNYKKHSEAITKLRANTSNDKAETIKYINNIPDSDFSGGYEDVSVKVKRAMLKKSYYPSYHDYDSQIVNAVLSHNDISSEKGREMAIGELKKLGFKKVKIKGGYVYYD